MGRNTLADTGIEIHRRHGTVPDHLQVFGERSSGTNFVNRLLAKNSALTPVDHYGWKHGFAQMTGVGARALIVGVARDPLAWARSMYAKPWHCPPEMQALDFPAFLRAEWRTVIDRKRYFPQSGERGTVGTPLQQDRHPITGAAFANLAQLRSFKAAYLLGLRMRGVNLVLCRLEAVQADPEAFVVAVSEAFDLPPVAAYAPVTKRLGSRFLANVENRPDPPEVVSPDDRAFLAKELDTRIESAWGFAPLA
ncbi:hypothetical protein [Maritimibacter sp. UBA3975]|uniref:hypothetical protein n=1 Tax=Maritimibacter sp. UBA3975 TaxID=1946833 RepID=UPI000C0AB065|nr:hypothetical protein [Maritimibacter sp. UBA3975]MAM60140.1 hypothetical protein [Maritimibacter sp.]|tara:strand:- start:42160 stop:42912 length:753 start_codon:yes stop_codon:yes gene_type:complete